MKKLEVDTGSRIMKSQQDLQNIEQTLRRLYTALEDEGSSVLGITLRGIVDHLHRVMDDLDEIGKAV